MSFYVEQEDYVRTRDGFDRLVDKRKDDNHDYYWYRFENGKTMTNPENGFVIKSSSNIIDLIEVGDYVNGCLIVEITKDPFIKGQINLWTNMILSEGEPFPNEYFKEKIIEKNIKSVLTKEQFESMEYKLGE